MYQNIFLYAGYSNLVYRVYCHVKCVLKVHISSYKQDSNGGGGSSRFLEVLRLRLRKQMGRLVEEEVATLVRDQQLTPDSVQAGQAAVDSYKHSTKLFSFFNILH